MNLVVFTGRLAAEPLFSDNGTPRCLFRLIRSEYAGRDADGNTKERTVALPITAFGKPATMLRDNVMVGDQLMVHCEIRNNNYVDKDGKENYGHDFVYVSHEFGAPGPAKREKLAARSQQ